MPFLIGAVIALLLGLGVGYYLGHDHGFEQAVRDASADQIVEEMNSKVSQEPRVEKGAVHGQLIGEWRSVGDATFTREFSMDGTIIDSYGADEEAEGTWTIFFSPTDEQAPFPIEPGVTYLKIMMVEEVLFFSIVSVTDDELVLSYLDRGGTLTFERVQ